MPARVHDDAFDASNASTSSKGYAKANRLKLNDEDVEDIVPWSLAEIGDRRAIGPLTGQLDRDDPSARVLAISALQKLNARGALPKLQELLQDNRRVNFGDRTTVGEAAKRAIAVMSQLP